MSLANRQARAEDLRTELSALRSAVEHANQEEHNRSVGDQIDTEIVRLEKEVEAAREDLKVATSSGSVEEAMAAMQVAAAPPLVVDRADEESEISADADEDVSQKDEFEPGESYSESTVSDDEESVQLGAMVLAPPIGEVK